MTRRPPICSGRSIHGVAVCRIRRARAMEVTWKRVMILVRWRCSRGLPPIGGPHGRGIVLHDIRPIIENSKHVVVVVLVRLLGNMWSRGLRLKQGMKLGLRRKPKLRLQLGLRLGLSTTSGTDAARTRNMPMFGLAVARQGGRVVGLKATFVRTAVTLFAGVPVGVNFEAGF